MAKTNNSRSLVWPTVQRLSEYLIILEDLEACDVRITTSSKLARIYGNTPSQVRQDLFKIASAGRVGQGYKVAPLIKIIRQSLGQEAAKKIIIAGCGGIGSTLVRHIRFSAYGLDLAALFDRDPRIIGQEIDGHIVRSSDGMEDFVRENKIELAGLCVSAESAQPVCDRLVRAGIKGVLNFTDKRLSVPDNVYLQYRQTVCAFMQLAYMAAHRPSGAASGRKRRKNS